MVKGYPNCQKTEAKENIGKIPPKIVALGKIFAWMSSLAPMPMIEGHHHLNLGNGAKAIVELMTRKFGGVVDASSRRTYSKVTMTQNGTFFNNINVEFRRENWKDFNILLKGKAELIKIVIK